MSVSKVTLTLPDELLAAVDRFVTGRRGMTRGDVCADALRDWLQRAQEADIVDYYVSLSAAERDDGAAWVELGGRSAERLWR